MFWKLALICLAFVCIDLLGHKLLKLKRSIGEYILLLLVIVCTIGSTVLQIKSSFHTKKSDMEEIFMAAQYIKDGNPEQAQMLLTSGSGYDKEAKVLNLFARLFEENYIQGYFESEQLLSEGGLGKENIECVNEIQAFCREQIGFTDDEKNDEEIVEDYVNNLGQVSYNENASSEASTQEDDEIESLLNDYIDILDFSDKQIESYTKTYDIESKLSGNNIEEVTLEDIEEIEEKYGDTEKVLRLKCKYYVNAQDFEEAKKAGKDLVSAFPTEENDVVYTDIIAQEAYLNVQTGNTDAFDDEDSEVRALVKKAQKKQDEAGELSASDEETQDKKDTLLEEAEELYQQAGYVIVKRAINYILAKEPLRGDTTGMYDLQLAKLYLTMGDRDTANTYLYQVINNNLDISEESSIREALDELIAQYNQLTDDELNAQFNMAINELIKAQSSNIVPNNEATVNGNFDSYVTNTLKYDKINIHISKVDTKEYPKIKAHVNINGYKDGNSELASEFEKEDFDLIDTQYEIEDFEIIKDDSNQISIAIVMDRSGSMEGAALENAKSAAEEAVSHMDEDNQKIALISYDESATLNQCLSNKKNTLKQGIRSISSNGGTNISAGLSAGLDELENESGSRAVILMSDGQDGGSEQDMQDAIERAVKENICVYTVAFGESDDDYMESIAETTGGKFVKASDSSELADIYLNLQKYIVNNYCLQYSVTKNTDVSSRYLTVNIDEYGTSATKEYYLNEQSKDESDETVSAIGKLEDDAIAISSVLPGNVSKQNIENGVQVTITGNGFEDGMNVTIGRLPLTNVTVNDSTSLTGTLQGSLNIGTYNVCIKTNEGKTSIANKQFKVTKAGTATSIKIGTKITITADSIGQIEEDTLVASGNVMVNGFLHVSDDMTIKVNDMPDDLELKPNITITVGSIGTLSGNAKIYISYGDFAKDDSNFTSLAMRGKDYIVQEGEYEINVAATSCSFDKTIGKPCLEIPNILKIEAPVSFDINSNGIGVTFDTLNLQNIIDNVDKALKGDSSGVSSGDDAGKAIKTKYSETEFNWLNTDSNLGLILRPDKIVFAGDVNVNVNDSISFEQFGIDSIGIKINSGDKNHEYWKLSGAIDFSKRIKGFKNSGIVGIDGSISSYYWLPDKITLGMDMEPGMPIFKIIEVKSLEGSVQGMSNLILAIYETLLAPESYEILGTNIPSAQYQGSEVILSANADAEVNLLASFYNENGKAKYGFVDKFKEWGDIGNITGNMSINFSKPRFKITTQMKFFGAQEAGGDLIINPSGLDIAAKLSLQAEMKNWGVALNGNVQSNIGGNLEYAYLKFGVDGSVKCSTLKIDITGEASVDIEFDWDFDEASATIRYKEGEQGTEKTLWYNKEGHLLLGNKVYVTTGSY